MATTRLSGVIICVAWLASTPTSNGQETAPEPDIQQPQRVVVAPLHEEGEVGPPPPMGQPFRYEGDTWKSWWFRRYAGSVEMREKAFYPPGYTGNYYFRPWKPDWVYPLPPSPVRNTEPWNEARLPSKQRANQPRAAANKAMKKAM